jgi:hypothetical protein
MASITTPYNSNFEDTTTFSNTTSQMALATATARTYTVPGVATDKYQIRFSYAYNSNVFVGYNVTAATPGAGLQTNTAYLEFRPGSDGSKRYANGGDVLSFITPDASAYVGIALELLPG